MDDQTTGFAPPPFNAAAALVQLKRQLRDLKLSERGLGFELKGRAVVELAVVAGYIDARLAKRASRVPQWVPHRLNNSADVRGFIDNVRRQMARWSSDE